MKLNKIMKKTVLATMAVLMAASLSFTGCSNGDDDPTPGSTPAGDQGTALGLSGYYNWEGSPYTISEQSDSGVTISYSGTAPTQYASGSGCDIAFGATKKVVVKVKNNGNDVAHVKIDVKNGSEDTSAVTAATIGGADADVQWGGCEADISAGETTEYVLTINPSVNANKFVVCLNSNLATNPTSGSITISNALKYN